MNGNLAYQLRKAAKIPLVRLAPMVGVSRIAYYKWLKGGAITPKHQAILESLLQKYPIPDLSFTPHYTVTSISFDCCKCSKHLVLKRRSLTGIASGLFCPDCYEHYWIAWEEGILHNEQKEKS